MDNSLALMDAPNVFGADRKVIVDFAGGNDIAYGEALGSPNRILAVGTSGENFGIVAMEALLPSAANVSISGRVITFDGRGLRNAVITLTDSTGEIRMARTS